MITSQETELHRIFRKIRQQAQMVLCLLADVAEKRDIKIKDETIAPSIESAEEQPLADVLRERATQLDRLFRLAVVGDFSRGKSTLINALLQREILATDSRPNTATKTVLRHGQPDRFVVTYLPRTGRASETHLSHNLAVDLAKFVSDASTSEEESDVGYEELLNGTRESLATQVACVDVWFESDFIHRMELEIVDTPGLGSVFSEHKEVTLKTIRTVDATLFVIQIDPGVGNSEIAFIRFIREYVPRIFFVVTKSDQVMAHELNERIEHMQKTIEFKAKIDVEHIFPVSAIKAMQTKYDQSGFDEFIPALETFLVRASGIARLIGPLRFARVYARQILDLAENNLENVYRSQHDVEVELEMLRAESVKVRAARIKLVAFVDERINLIRSNALYGLDGLSGVIKDKVENELKGLRVEQLREADQYIQASAKEAIVDWLNGRKEKFKTEIQLMNRTLKSKLIRLLEQIDFDDEQLLLIGGLQVEIDVPLDTQLYTRDIGDQVVQMLLATGISSTIADVAGKVARVASDVWKSIQNGIGRIFGGGRNHTQDQARQMYTRLCDALSTSQPNSNRNAYQIIVYGQEQTSKSGVQQAIYDTFTEWGENLKKDIEQLIDNNLNIRLHDLEVQLKQRQKGLHNQQKQQDALQVEKKSLLQILSDLEALDSRVKELAEG